MESNDLHRGGSGEGWTSQYVSFNRSCLQWLGIVDSGSSSALNQTELSVSFSPFITTFPICAYEKWLAVTHMHKRIHTHILLLIMSNIRWWNKHCQVMGENLAASPPTPSKTSGSQGHTHQLSHHYTLVHSTASVLSILNQAGTKLISLSPLFSCVSGCWIFCD